MTAPGRRPVGETLAELDGLNPALAAEVRAALSEKRARDDLADAESLLREHARAGRDAIARAVGVLLVEYDARAGRVTVEPQVRRPGRAPVRPVRPPRPDGDVVVP